MIHLPPPPVSRLIGFVLKSIEPGHAVFEMEADEPHHNPMGTLHGGIYCDIADAAMGYAYAATPAEGDTFTTIELKINFLRAVGMSFLVDESSCQLRRGRFRAERGNSAYYQRFRQTLASSCKLKCDV